MNALIEEQLQGSRNERALRSVKTAKQLIIEKRIKYLFIFPGHCKSFGVFSFTSIIESVHDLRSGGSWAL